MQVSVAIKQRVEAKIRECIALAEAKYKRKFDMPTIEYTLRGSTAGWAKFSIWTINLHPGLLMQASTQEEMLEVTVPHEMAHLVTDVVYPEVMQRGAMQLTRRGVRRGKREVHGPRWAEVMSVFGLPATRCHFMDTSQFARKREGGGRWECSCGCGKSSAVGPKIHKQLLANPSSRWYHRGYPLRQVDAPAAKPKGVVVIKTGFEGPGVTTVHKVGGFKDVTVVKSQDQTGSKIDQCWAIYKRNVGSSRAAIIQTMVSIANCTPAGAATYYATCKKRYENGVL